MRKPGRNPREITPSKDLTLKMERSYKKEGPSLRQKQGIEMRPRAVIPDSGLTLCACVVGAGLLKEWEWTGALAMGC